jgi:hypothetical protein
MKILKQLWLNFKYRIERDELEIIDRLQKEIIEQENHIKFLLKELDTSIKFNEKLNLEKDDLFNEIDNIVKRSEKENYYNNIRPQTFIIYNARTFNNKRIANDVRGFVKKDYALPYFKGSNNDEIMQKILLWVIQNIKYTSDDGEHWQFPFETYERKLGDCEDGAILMMCLALNSGIPYWRLRLNAGEVLLDNNRIGGHCWLTYLNDDEEWMTIDWCYWVEQSLSGLYWKESEKYLKIWFSWNEKYMFGDLPKEVKNG